MPDDIILSSYILRLTRKRHRLHVGLQDVRTGQTRHFDSIEALIAHLEHLGLCLQGLLESNDVARAPPKRKHSRPP